MEVQQRYFWNNLSGWMVFAGALAVYLASMEPTTSLWDSGEFIAAAYKLQVVHPPGAPFFLMLNRLATLLAPSPVWVAPLVNGVSALASAFTVLFLFWTITALGGGLLRRRGIALEKRPFMALLAAGFVGSTAFIFTDTFWFSATEGEVYALSAFFMALIFWLMLKWQARAHLPGSLKYLVLIAYLLGLSIGVHLLSLLVIPALVLLYYFQRYTPTRMGIVFSAILDS